MRALILSPFDKRHLARLRAVMDVTYESWLDTRALTDPDALAERIRSEDISILVVEADFVFEETFQDCPGLKFVGICRAATNQVDLNAAADHGVTVVNTPGRNARAVAEHAFALMLSLARRIPQANEYVRSAMSSGGLNPVAGYTDFRGVELGSRTVGIIGMGAIGRTLADLCLGFGMSVIAYDPYTTDVPRGVRMTDLDTLARESDFVSVHVPLYMSSFKLAPDTTGLLDTEFFTLMKPSAYLVNCSDYRIADEAALLHALRERLISGAALDVFDTSPNGPLLDLDNVILTPHVGGATEETVERHSKMMTDDILRFINGQRPVNLVVPTGSEPAPASPPARSNPLSLEGEG